MGLKLYSSKYHFCIQQFFRRVDNNFFNVLATHIKEIEFNMITNRSITPPPLKMVSLKILWWPLWSEKIILEGIVLSSCLLYPIMVIQSYIIYKDKIHQKLE